MLLRVSRKVVLNIVVRSLNDGHPYTAEIRGHRVTVLVRASNASEAYLAICAEGFLHPEILAIILNAVPGLDESDWQAEPGGVAGVTPDQGQIIWSTIIPPEVQMDVLRLGDK